MMPGFWQQIKTDNRDISISSNRLGSIGRPWFIFPDGNGPRGSFSTFADLSPNLRSRDVIILGGVLREQAQTPLGVYDVTIIGAGNAPRQATSGGLTHPTGGGASWVAPVSPVASTPLLEIRSAGWKVSGIEFAPHTSSAGIRLTSSLTVDTTDASHTIIEDCVFSGEGGAGQIGVEDLLGCSFIEIRRNRFSLLATAILALGTGVRVPSNNLYENNRFSVNTSDIKMSLNHSVIKGNNFMTPGAGAANKVISDTFIAVQGGSNHIVWNFFNNTEAEIAPGSGYTGAATDLWMNYVNNQAALAFGQPA